MSAIEITFTVVGELPPAKGEAKSMLAPGHGQASRVRALLVAASAALAGREPLKGEVGLELVVRAPISGRLPDATNMLGGVGDVLQARLTGADVAHLGPLALTACYLDDKQISEIIYRRVISDETGYVVRLWPLTS